MRKRIAFIMATVCVLLITGCGTSNSAEDPSGVDSQMAANVKQTETEEKAASKTINEGEDLENETVLDTAIKEAIFSENIGKYLPGECQGIGYKIIETFEEEGVLSVYALTEYIEYGFQDGVLVNISGTDPKVLMKFKQTESENYELLFYTRLDLFSDLSEKEIERLLEPLNKAGKSYVYTDEDLQEVRAQADEDALVYLQSINRDADVGIRTEHKGNLLTDLVSNTDLLMELSKDEIYSLYPEWIGTQERIENNIRYIYQTEFNEELQQIIYSKIQYDTNETVEQQVVDILHLYEPDE